MECNKIEKKGRRRMLEMIWEQYSYFYSEAEMKA